MFQVREEILRNTHVMVPAVQFGCPVCQEEGEYYRWPPIVCTNCGCQLEQLFDMEDDLDLRVEHYFEGEL